MASIAGVRTNQLVGYGLVVGLAKTGDGSVELTKQSIASMIKQFGVIASNADINASNAATDTVTNKDEIFVDTIIVGSAIQTTATVGQTLNSTTVGNAVSVSEEETYDAAFDLLKKSLYSDAAIAFTQFIQRFPNSELTDDAWYWTGEARFVTREFSQSLDAFQNVINNFMGSPRIPASYLKVGYIQYEYGAYIKARETLDFVVSSFPNHRVVVNAKSRLEKMDREGY